MLDLWLCYLSSRIVLCSVVAHQLDKNLQGRLTWSGGLNSSINAMLIWDYSKHHVLFGCQACATLCHLSNISFGLASAVFHVLKRFFKMDLNQCWYPQNIVFITSFAHRITCCFFWSERIMFSSKQSMLTTPVIFRPWIQLFAVFSIVWYFLLCPFLLCAL